MLLLAPFGRSAATMHCIKIVWSCSTVRPSCNQRVFTSVALQLCHFRLSGFQSSLLYTCLYCDEERPNLSDMRRSTFMIYAAQLRSITEIVVRSPFLSVNILLVFSVTPFKIDQNKNQNHATY